MNKDKAVNLDTLKDVIDDIEAVYGTTKEAIAQFLEDLKSGTIKDKQLAGRIKGLTEKLGYLGDLIGIALGYAIDGKNGAVAAAVGALAGAVVGGIVVGVFGLVAFPGVAVAGVLIGGYAAWAVGNIVEEKVLDKLKEYDQKPGSNVPEGTKPGSPDGPGGQGGNSRQGDGEPGDGRGNDGAPSNKGDTAGEGGHYGGKGGDGGVILTTGRHRIPMAVTMAAAGEAILTADRHLIPKTRRHLIPTAVTTMVDGAGIHIVAQTETSHPRPQYRRSSLISTEMGSRLFS